MECEWILNFKNEVNDKNSTAIRENDKLKWEWEYGKRISDADLWNLTIERKLFPEISLNIADAL